MKIKEKVGGNFIKGTMIGLQGEEEGGRE